MRAVRRASTSLKGLEKELTEGGLQKIQLQFLLLKKQMIFKTSDTLPTLVSLVASCYLGKEEIKVLLSSCDLTEILDLEAYVSSGLAALVKAKEEKEKK